MRLVHRIPAVVLLAATLAPAAALAAGYGIYEQGCVALGMGGAATAAVRDPSALFFNSAALTQLEGTQVVAGGTWLQTRTSFAGTQPYPGIGVTEEMKTGNFPLPTGYLTHRFGSKWGVGVGVNAPFGLGIEWKDPEQFTGRTIATKADLKTVNGNVSLAWAASPRWSVGLGADMLFANVELHRINTAIVPGGGGALANVAEVTLESNYESGTGWHFGVLFVASDSWSFGTAYRSRIDVDVEGDATFTQIPTGDAAFDAAVAAGLPPAQKVKTKLHFPATWSFGTAWNPTADWTWAADFGYTQWKAFDELPLDFATTNSIDTAIEENYDDSFRLSVGAEHRLPGWTYRVGYYFDEAAAPSESVSPLLPDAPRHGVTAGLGKRWGKDGRWSVDAYNLALFVENRDTRGIERDGFNGTYKSYVNAAGASIAYRW